MNEIEILQNRIKKLEDIVFELVKSDRYIYKKTVQILDGRNIQFGLTTGTEIGTASTEKLAFHGKTPVVQASAISARSGGLMIDGEARTAIGTIITVLSNKGITA